MSDENNSNEVTPYVDGNLIQSKAVCGAKNKNREGVCQSKPMANGRCRLHGGATPKGIASPHFKTGKHSKYIPDNLLEKYQTAVNDEELVALRDEIALVDALSTERLEKIYAGESKDWWDALKCGFTELEQAIQMQMNDSSDEGEARMLSMIERVGTSISDGSRSFSAFEVLQPMIEQRRKLVESESKRLKDLEQNITVEQAMGIIGLLSGIVKRHVTDPKQLAAISEELSKVVN